VIDVMAIEYILLVNGLGGTTNMELAIAANDAMTQLKQRYGMRVVAPIVGTLMSALEMPGFSLSLLPATEALLQHLYAPTNGMYRERERERERERARL
jgi:dihydroxyacetone kinase